MRIALISCGQRKLPGIHAAEKIYSSNRFRLAMSYAKGRFDLVFILSARHGLLRPSQKIKNYDLSLNNVSQESRKRWAKVVARDIRLKIPAGSTLYFFCGTNYRKLLIKMLGEYKIRVPQVGLNQGQQMRWFKNRLEKSQTRNPSPVSLYTRQR